MSYSRSQATRQHQATRKLDVSFDDIRLEPGELSRRPQLSKSYLLRWGAAVLVVLAAVFLFALDQKTTITTPVSTELDRENKNEMAKDANPIPGDNDISSGKITPLPRQEFEDAKEITPLPEGAPSAAPSASIKPTSKQEKSVLQITTPNAPGQSQAKAVITNPIFDILKDKPTQTSTPAGERAREIIAKLGSAGHSITNDDLAKVFAKAGEFMQQKQHADAHLLYFYAARQGYAPAAFTLATQADPNHFQEGGSLLDKPDLVQAVKWYRVAADKGHQEAKQRLQNLKNWAKNAARQGKLPESQLLLLN